MIMKRLIKLVLIVLSVLAIIFFSLKIENLEEYKTANTKVTFNATEYAEKFWKEKVPSIKNKAIETSELIPLLVNNPKEAFENHSRVLGISKTHYFITKGSGKITSIEDEYFVVKINENQTVKIATDFIFGNAVRDGSGEISINEFLNMTDFNNVSVAINKLVKKNVVRKLQTTAEQGKTIDFVGATEIYEENIDTENIRIIPVIANLGNGEKN